MAVRADAVEQTAMDEQLIQHPELEQALEEHQMAKDEAAEYRLRVKNAKKRVANLIEGLALADPTTEDEPVVVRVTRFRITKKFVKGRTVSFATEDRVQLVFGLADGEGDEDTLPDDTGSDADDNAAVSRLEAEEAHKKPGLTVVGNQDDEGDSAS